MDDRDIIQLYFQRSETAVAETQRKYSKYCYAVAYNILHSHEDAQECVNDMLERAWSAIPPAQPSVLRTFLGKITRNLALDALEKSKAGKRGSGQAALALSELEECIASKDVTGEQVVELEMITQVINGFLKQQSVAHRKIFVRRYWYTDSMESIAVDYGMTVSGVKNTLYRLRKKLKKELEKEGVSL